MNETLHNKHETPIPSVESLTQKPAHEASKKIESLANKESLDSRINHLESARATIEKQAKSNELINLDQESNNTPPPHHYITKHIKAESYKQTIKHVQNNLTPTEAKFSKIIHHPKIETISEIGAKTIARPSSIIYGSLMALTAGIVFIVVARHIGFYLSPLVFSVLFVIGYALGLLLEAVTKIIVKLFKRKPRYQ